MSSNVELIDKVIFMKGRVWTIYGTTNAGVFCFEGVKPYESFKFNSHDRFYRERFNTSFFVIEDLEFIDGEEIEKCLNKMKSEDKKKLTRKKAVEFLVYLTGHSKSFVNNSIKETAGGSGGFQFAPGHIVYDLCKMDGALCLFHNLDGGYTTSTYYDFITYEHHDVLNEKSKNAYIEQILEDNSHLLK